MTTKTADTFGIIFKKYRLTIDNLSKLHSVKQRKTNCLNIMICKEAIYKTP